MAVNNAVSWSKKWELPFANNQINTIHIGRNNPKNAHFIENVEITTNSSVRDLGIIVDSNLTFKEHNKNNTKIHD